MFIERKTAKFVQLLLLDLRGYLSGCGEKPDANAFKVFARRLYPRVHRAYLGRDILSVEDSAFVRAHGSENLFDLPLAAGELASDGGWTLVGRPGLRPRDATFLVIGQLEARVIYQIIEDLNVFFSDERQYESAEQIVLFASLMRARLEEGCGILT